MQQTIFALSSGALPSGVAIIRLSGPRAFEIAERLSATIIPVRRMVRALLKDPSTDIVLDDVLVTGFKAPSSFTGEDVVELHCHGGKATIGAILRVLSDTKDCRMAEAGEFSRRAFENGKMDLTELEGLSDLIAAETEAQRKQALR